MATGTGAEFAKGLPAKERVHPLPSFKEPRVLEFGVHHHFSEGNAGEHFDLRIGDPETGHAHSWALKHLPAPGERRLAVQQPTHTLAYMDFQGRLPAGTYGAGDVKLLKRDRTEVLRSGPDSIRFNLYGGKDVEEYALSRMAGQNWLLQNVTTTRASSGLPSSKPSYKVIPEPRLGIEDPRVELQAKIDGAHVLYQFKDPGSLARVLSYRPTERPTGIIEHTHQLPAFYTHKTPAALRDTILRGELYATDHSGKALPAARVGGILNAGVWRSREKQNAEGDLKPVVFDVVKWRGKDVEDSPYSHKRELLQQAVAAAPWLNLPRTATTPKGKRKLIEDIKTGKEPSTEEGVVEWHHDRSVPGKTKFLSEHDVVVRDIFKEKGTRNLAGGFAFSRTPDGPIVGHVGSGMSHEMKKHMLAEPSKYEGLRARILAQKAPAHYAPRAPSFLSFHLDQDIPEGVKMATASEWQEKHAADYQAFLAMVKNAYKLQGHTSVQGIDIAIENDRGSVRKGTDRDGHRWRTVMKFPYGYIVGSKGKDNEGVDVYVGPNKETPFAFVVHQHKPDGTGFDEDKIMLGWNTEHDARKAYLQQYDKMGPKILGPISKVTIEKLKKVTESGKRLEKIAGGKSFLNAGPDLETPAEMKAALRPGDILVGRTKKPNIWTRLSEFGQGAHTSHAAMYVGDGRVVHSQTDKGVFNDSLNRFHANYDFSAYRVRAPKEVRDEAAKFVKDSVGKSYPFLAPLKAIFFSKADAKKKELREQARNAEGFMCSSLIAAAYPKHIFGSRPIESVRPVDFVRSTNTTPVAHYVDTETEDART